MTRTLADASPQKADQAVEPVHLCNCRIVGPAIESSSPATLYNKGGRQ